MINSFHYIYSLIDFLPDIYFVRYKSLLRFLVRFLLNSYLHLAYRLRHLVYFLYPLSKVDDDSNFIISLTSFPPRINNLWIVVESLLNQTVKPKFIVLWLSEEQFPNLNVLPSRLLKLVDRGLLIKIKPNDIKSHKKYFYAFSEFKNFDIVLADDDIIYPNYFCSDILNAAKLYPNTVIARFTKKIRWSISGELLPYISWRNFNSGCLEHDVFFGSGGGVLIPKSSIHPDFLNLNSIIKCCPTADDIWLNSMCRLISTKIYCINRKFILLPIINFNDISLTSLNNGQGHNDVQLLMIIEYCLSEYGVNPFSKVL